MSSFITGCYFFDKAATYQIRVLGWVDPTWSDRLEGMTISQIPSETGPPITLLEGKLCDQAALAGVLNTLYELRLSVLFVNCKDAE
jgi:hypothetical protein